MGVSVQVNKASVRAAIRAIELFSDRKTDAIKAQVATSALRIDAHAKQIVPVDTGRLRSSIHPEFENNGLNAKVVSNVEYAIFIEMGSSRKAPRGFLYPAAEAERQNFLQAIRRILSTK